MANLATGLSGVDATAFAEQFAALASRPVAAHVVGDGETFQQALCFPLGGLAQADFIQPTTSAAPYLLVEMLTGHLVCLRLADCTANRFSLSTFLRSIERPLERLPQGAAAWPGIQKSIEMMARRRVVLVDFVLKADEKHFWRECYPQGDAWLTEMLFRGLPPIAPLRRKQAVTALIDIQSAHYRAAITDFIAGLDNEVIQAIYATGQPPSLSRYNTYRRGEATAARYRIQAVEAVPLLGYMLGEENHRAARLRRLVDSGTPLWPALADTSGVTEEAVRWLRGKTADDVSDAWLGRIPELLQSLAHLAPEKRPKTRDEWTAYTDFALVLARVSSSNRHRCWLRDLARLGWGAARQKFEAMHATPSDLLEMTDLLREITGAVGGELLPHIADFWREDDREWLQVNEAVETVFLEASLLKQIRASLRWHELQLMPPIEEYATEEDNPAANAVARLDYWPAPLIGSIKLGGLTAHFLTTTAQLRDEGMRMEHCVGSYTGQCLFNGANIVSLRNDDGRSVSTAELRMLGHSKRLELGVVQHKAQRNSSPSAQAEKALSYLLSKLNADGMQQCLQQMLEQLRQRRALDDNRRHWLGETPNSPNRLRCLKAALKLHVGYDRFLDAGRKALA